MALRRVPIPTSAYSSRNGAGVRLVVCHTAEGSTSYSSLGAYFQSGVEASSHVGIDDTPGEIGEYVAAYGGAAWTQSAYNSVAVAAELCGFAAWSRAEWLEGHPVMLSNLALWIGEECSRFGLPIVALGDAEAQGGGRGVTQHINLGAAGGGHVDCDYGTGSFPFAEVLEMARGGAPPPSSGSAPAPPPTTGVAAPPWPGRYLSYPPAMQGDDCRQWQAQLASRGWGLAVDGWYGEESRDVTLAFQGEALAEGHDIGAPAPDGIVGPATWALGWEKAIT